MPRQVDPVAEVGRHQDADDRVADGVLVAEPVRVAQRAIELGHTVALAPLKRSAVRSLGERLQCLDVAGLGRRRSSFDPADVGGEDAELVVDGLDRQVAGLDPPGLRQVDFREPLDLGLGRQRPCLRRGRS